MTVSIELAQLPVFLAKTGDANAYAWGLAVVCALQYFLYFWRTTRFRRQMKGLEDQLASADAESAVKQLENDIWREFVSQTDVERSLRGLLKRFVPNCEKGFAAFIRIGSEKQTVPISHGLTADSCRRLQIDADLIEQIRSERIVVLKHHELYDYEMISRLDRTDRTKINELFLIAVCCESDLVGVVATTELLPHDADRQHQLALAERLMTGVGVCLRRDRTFERQQHQLEMTTEMLELRSLADSQFENPQAMADAILSRVMSHIDAERACLFLLTETGPQVRAWLRCGSEQQPDVETRYREHELSLACAALGKFHISQPRRDALFDLGIDSLIGAALVVPLIHRGQPIGLITLTSDSEREFSSAQFNLVRWASDFLAESLVRCLNQAVLERQALEDGLTGLANRRAFDQRIEQELKLAEQIGGDCSVVLIDLDRFKSINDSFGHPAGDAVLKQVSQILQSALQRTRASDRPLAARYGGEELALLMPGLGMEGALRVAEEIRIAIESLTTHFQGRNLRVTASAGLASFPEWGMTPEDLIASADAALYEAKQSGRNRVVCATNGVVDCPAIVGGVLEPL